MDKEFWAAVVGAILGGLIAFVIQMIALNAAKKERLRDQANQRKALGYSLLFKMIQIYSRLAQLSRHMEDSFDEAKKNGLAGEPWQFVMPLANVPDRVVFSTDEMSMLLSLESDDLFSDLFVMDDVLNSAIVLFEMYKLRRTLLTDMLPANRMEGIKGTTTLNGEQMAFLRPKMVELNGLVNSMRESCAEDAGRAHIILKRLGVLFRERAGIVHEIVTKRP